MKSDLKKLVEQINQEVQELSEAREELIEIKKKMVEAGFSEDQACKKLATAIGGLDFRTIKNWLRKETHLQDKKLLRILLFIKVYEEVEKDEV